MSITRKTANKTEIIKARARQTAGRITGNRRQQARGRREQAEGNFKQALAKVLAAFRR